MVTLSGYLSIFEDVETLTSEFNYLMENSKSGLKNVLDYIKTGYGILDDYSVFNAIVFDPKSLHLRDFEEVLSDCKKYMTSFIEKLKKLRLKSTFKTNPRWVSFVPNPKAVRRGRHVLRKDGVECLIMQEVRVEVDKEKCMKESKKTGEFMADFIVKLIKKKCVHTVNLPSTPAYGLWRRDLLFLQIGDSCDASMFGDVREIFEETKDEYELSDVNMINAYSVVEGGDRGRVYTQNEMAARFFTAELKDDAFRVEMMRELRSVNLEEAANLIRNKAYELFVEKLFF